MTEHTVKLDESSLSFLQGLQRMADAQFIARQKPLDPDVEAAIFEDLDSLYEDDDKPT